MKFFEEMTTVEIILAVNLAGLAILSFFLAYQTVKSNKTLARTLQSFMEIILAMLQRKE